MKYIEKLREDFEKPTIFSLPATDPVAKEKLLECIGDCARCTVQEVGEVDLYVGRRKKKEKSLYQQVKQSLVKMDMNDK